MKQLSSRWAVASLVIPALMVVIILVAGVQSPEASNKGKGFLQVAFTGVISSTNNFPQFQSVLLNVVAVRLNPSSNLSIGEDDPNWQTISVPSGNSQAFASLSFGGNFGPNGNAVSIGQGRSEIQIDLAQIQNAVIPFNTGKIRAQPYNQIELLLDPITPGNAVPRCGSGTAVGEGCITYPLQFAPNFSTIRQASAGGILNISRNQTTLLTIAINANLQPPATSSDQAVLISPEICAAPTITGDNVPNCLFSQAVPTPAADDTIGAVVTGTVKDSKGSTAKNTTVVAELAGTSRVTSMVVVDKKEHTYTLTLPLGTYDLYVSGSNTSSEAISSLNLNQAGHYTVDFTVSHKGIEPISGVITDACSGQVLQGATVNVYAPPSFVGDPNSPGTFSACPSPSSTAGETPTAVPTPGCQLTCGDFSSGQVPPGCVIIASASTSDTGVFPLPGNASNASAIHELPRLEDGQDYALDAGASGFNSVLVGASAKRNALFKCGSATKNNRCNFSLPRGQFDVVVNRATPAAAASMAAENVLVNTEDSGTFNGESVGLVTIPAGNTSNLNPVTILVPASPTPTVPPPTPTPKDKKATPTPTGTPVTIGGPASFDLFAAVQDLFDKSPQKVGGHTYAVLSGVPAPAYCSTPDPAATPVTLNLSQNDLLCVGHGSIAGTFNSNPDVNTRVVVFKDNVAVQVNPVPLGITNNDFSLCAPVDSYDVARYEVQPTGSPSPVGGSVAVALVGPTVILGPTPTASVSPTPVACHGICSDSGELSGTTNCFLCQDTTPGVTLP